MKNTIKMSLVAALAVAGLSTTASAGGLEEAIKGVSISGKMEVEYDYTSQEVAGADDTTTNTWDLDWDVTAKIPVNDQITAVFGLEGDTENDAEDGSITGKGQIQDTKVYFQYANGPVTAMVGKQGMAGAPWYHDERGMGLVAVYNAGPVALAAAHFTDVNGGYASGDTSAAAAAALTITDAVAAGAIDTHIDNQDVTAAAIIAGNIADSGINASLWYAMISNVGSSYSLNVNGKIADMVNFDLRHTETDLDDMLGVNTSDIDNSLTKLVVSADIGVVNARLGYGMTDEEGGLVSFESGDTDAATTFGLEQLNIEDMADADVWLIGAGTTFGATSVNLDYIDGETGNVDFDELLFQVDYAMSKNFTVGAHYSWAEVDSVDQDNAAISLEYKF